MGRRAGQVQPIPLGLRIAVSESESVFTFKRAELLWKFLVNHKVMLISTVRFTDFHFPLY
jgi:hypothetical protein